MLCSSGLIGREGRFHFNIEAFYSFTCVGAQFGNADAKAACYQCLEDDEIDPCMCVDGVKNGTITYTPLASDSGNLVVCENRYATISCADQGLVIDSIGGESRHANDYTESEHWLLP